MEKYLTLDNLETAFKFVGILSSGIFSGGAIYLSKSQLPGMLAMTDMDQALMNFRYFWPRVKQMPRASYFGGISGIGAFLVHRRTEDLPWLFGGLGCFFNGIYTVTRVYPNSIEPLMNPNLLKENDESYVRDMFKKFADYHDVRTVVGTAVFVAFTLSYFKSKN